MLEEIAELDKEAERVQKAVSNVSDFSHSNILLDLKQKQANISEAKSGRKLAEDTSRQGNTILVFTVVHHICKSLLSSRPFFWAVTEHIK